MKQRSPVGSLAVPNVNFYGRPCHRLVSRRGHSGTIQEGKPSVFCLPLAQQRYFGSKAKSTCTATELFVCPGMIEAAELSLACSAITAREGGAGTAPGR